MIGHLLRASLAMLLGPGLVAQDWRAIGPFGGNQAACDHARGEILTVGGETFAADRNGWRQRTGSLVPVGWTLCHDPVRARTIALNAINPSVLQTFEWDGVAWRGMNSAHTPAFHLGSQPHFVAAYDAQRRAVMAFGVSNNVSQTWAWDGTDWQLLGTSGPTNLGGLGGMAYDEARGVMLLAVLRWVNSAWSAEYWEGNGVQWNQRIDPVAPSHCASMAYDPLRQRTVLVGAAGTWEFDASVGGGTWQQLTTTPLYYGYGPIFFARHRGRIVGVGSGLDEWTGQSWVTFLPLERYGSRMRLHPNSGRVVSFGHWYPQGPVTAEHDGFGWHEVYPSVSPAARIGHAMWNDGHDVWLFGGFDGASTLLGDTWRWDGQNWSQVITPQAPSPRRGVAVAYDDLRQRAVAFGGSTAPGTAGNGGSAETWEFDGATWMQRYPAVAPPARCFAAAAYDPIAARTMICLGDLASGFIAIDAWQWDGQQWTAAPPVNTYTWFAGQQHDLTFDPIAGRLVLAHGFSYSFGIEEFTGTGWVARPAPPYQQSGREVQLVADKDGNLLLSNGGALFRRMITNSTATRFGSGCVADLSVSSLTHPRLGAASGIEVVGAQPGGPVLLLAANAAMSLPLGNGCTQLVSHTQWTFFLLADAFGVARLPLSIPDNIALRGYQLNFQALTLAATAPGFAASAGLRLTIGD